MSQQESSYFDSEQETVYQPRHINSDPSEQQERQERQEQQEPTVYYVTPEQSMLGGEKLVPMSVVKARSYWGGAAFFVLLMLIGGLIWGTQVRTNYANYPSFQGPGNYPYHGHPHGGHRGFDGGQMPPAPSLRSFTVSGQAKVVISNTDETVHISTGPDSSVITVSEANMYYNAYNPTNNVQSQLVSNNEVDITGSQSSDGFNGADASENELDITVPSLTDIQITNNIGDIVIDNVTGQIQADTAQGTIALSQTNLRGSSTLHTGSGDITFDGTLDTSGNYTMTADDGSVSIILPDNAAFHLQVGSTTDEINNEFSGDSVGNSPRANLTISADNGSGFIDIQMANP